MVAERSALEDKIKQEYREAMEALVEARKAKIRGQDVPNFAAIRNRVSRARVSRAAADVWRARTRKEVP
jgi:hypothetical protein